MSEISPIETGERTIAVIASEHYATLHFDQVGNAAGTSGHRMYSLPSTGVREHRRNSP